MKRTYLGSKAAASSTQFAVVEVNPGFATPFPLDPDYWIAQRGVSSSALIQLDPDPGEPYPSRVTPTVRMPYDIPEGITFEAEFTLVNLTNTETIQWTTPAWTGEPAPRGVPYPPNTVRMYFDGATVTAQTGTDLHISATDGTPGEWPDGIASTAGGLFWATASVFAVWGL